MPIIQLFQRHVDILKSRVLLFILVIYLAPESLAQAQSLSVPDQLIERYAEYHLTLTSDSELEQPLFLLLEEAQQYRDANPASAEAWAATARIRFGYANTQGMVTGLDLIKESRQELEQAITLDASAQEGAALAFLGYLYAGMPPWPLGFGSSKKAAELLEAALKISDSSMANNYYYAVYLFAKTKRHEEATQRLLRAKASAAALPAQPHMQALRLRGIDELLQRIAED
ncbi:MAG: TRAP transporter TatT component family protein [Pseudohongiellaceae bacterium]